MHYVCWIRVPGFSIIWCSHMWNGKSFRCVLGVCLHCTFDITQLSITLTRAIPVPNLRKESHRQMPDLTLLLSCNSITSLLIKQISWIFHLLCVSHWYIMREKKALGFRYCIAVHFWYLGNKWFKCCRGCWLVREFWKVLFLWSVVTF